MEYVDTHMKRLGSPEPHFHSCQRGGEEVSCHETAVQTKAKSCPHSCFVMTAGSLCQCQVKETVAPGPLIKDQLAFYGSKTVMVATCNYIFSQSHRSEPQCKLGALGDHLPVQVQPQ